MYIRTLDICHLDITWRHPISISMWTCNVDGCNAQILNVIYFESCAKNIRDMKSRGWHVWSTASCVETSKHKCSECPLFLFNGRPCSAVVWLNISKLFSATSGANDNIISKLWRHISLILLGADVVGLGSLIFVHRSALTAYA